MTNTKVSAVDGKEISAAFPFESKFVEVEGSKIHYVEEGTGDPILLLHGEILFRTQPKWAGRSRRT